MISVCEYSTWHVHMRLIVCARCMPQRSAIAESEDWLRVKREAEEAAAENEGIQYIRFDVVLDARVICG